MKAILEFNLPDDKQDFVLASNAMNLWSVLYEMDNYLRANTKYAPDSMSQEKYDTFEEVRDKLFELMNDNKVGLDMVE